MSGQSNADPCFPKQAGELGKGDLMVFKDKRPGKINDYSVCKTGKHGHARISFIAYDIFDGSKFEDSHPTTHNIMCPRLFIENGLMTNYDDTHVQYMKEDGESGEIALPEYPEGYAESLMASFDQCVKEGTNLNITIQRSMGLEQIMSHRTDKN
ncbi:Eukaryotic_translation initiation factor 5A [Hexamita inflata]|uniref:Eukaryotic translation initiation factor 5A n=1 Tax=Hexamita inflata TaxID=28002 RepID=A0AA86NNR6_9EUKA|nr:Eukaryotic translation initiation factor 5A [Hexamita inflata]CAI9922709.1 Eukaryotic translation initiation factor 5A [Hexamita inflata]